MSKLKVVAMAMLSLVVLIVVLQNTQAVETNLLFLKVTMPNAALLFGTLIIGFAIGDLTAGRIVSIAKRTVGAKVIHAEGEFQASGRLRDAAETIEGHPMAMQMRFLQTLSDVGAANNTTIVFPMPIELLNGFVKDPSRNGKSKRMKPMSELPVKPLLGAAVKR
jgi:uncharacterized integral membrane protein